MGLTREGGGRAGRQNKDLETRRRRQMACGGGAGGWRENIGQFNCQPRESRDIWRHIFKTISDVSVQCLWLWCSSYYIYRIYREYRYKGLGPRGKVPGLLIITFIFKHFIYENTDIIYIEKKLFNQCLASTNWIPPPPPTHIQVKLSPMGRQENLWLTNDHEGLSAPWGSELQSTEKKKKFDRIHACPLLSDDLKNPFVNIYYILWRINKCAADSTSGFFDSSARIVGIYFIANTTAKQSVVHDLINGFSL